MIGDISPNKLAFTIPSENGNIQIYDFRKLNTPVRNYLNQPIKIKIPNADDLITQTKYFSDNILIAGSLSGNIHLLKIQFEYFQIIYLI